MSLTPKVAVLKASGGTAEVEIFVSHLHKAKYQLLLFDDSGANPQGIGTADGKGKTGDGIPDKFSLPDPVSSLHRKSIFWQCGLASLSQVDGSAPLMTTVRVWQNNTVVAVDDATGSLACGQFHLKVEA